MTFAELFGAWYAHYVRTVLPATAINTKKYMQRHVLPHLGHLNVLDIKPKMVLDTANHISKHSTYFAHRCVADIARIYDYAIVVLEITDRNPAGRLCRYTMRHHVVGRQYMPIAQVPAMLQTIDSTASSYISTKIAFWLIVYTGVRRQEAVLAKRSEFDFEQRLWTIPTERMKSRREHTVPLSDQVIVMLQAHFALSKSEWAFTSISNKDKPISTWSPYYLLEQSGYRKKQTLHGFRKIFSTHAHESGLWTIDAIELSLAHTVGGVRGIYNHATMMTERVRLMQWWANEVDKWRGIS